MLESLSLSLSFIPSSHPPAPLRPYRSRHASLPLPIHPIPLLFLFQFPLSPLLLAFPFPHLPKLLLPLPFPLPFPFRQIHPVQRTGALQQQPGADALEVEDVVGVAGELHQQRVGVGGEGVGADGAGGFGVEVGVGGGVAGAGEEGFERDAREGGDICFVLDR